jgi:hypothetical protein
MRNDLIIDFETMGQDVNKCAVIDISAMVFNWDKMTSDDPYTLADISKCRKFKFDVKEQVQKYGYEIDPSTLAFWNEQSKEVRRNIAPKSSDLSVADFVKQFTDFLIEAPTIKYWWSRSNTFDPMILSRLFQSQNKLPHMEQHLKYWSVRDTRTYIDAKFNFSLKKNGFAPCENDEKWDSVFKAHDSSWDILADVMRLQSIVRAENDMEQIKV